MSRQREWQKRKLAEGKCKVCAKPRNRYACYCDDCQRRVNTRQNELRREKKIAQH